MLTLDLVFDELPFTEDVGERVWSIKPLLLTESRYYFDGFNVGAILWVNEIGCGLGFKFLAPPASLLSDCWLKIPVVWNWLFISRTWSLFKVNYCRGSGLLSSMRCTIPWLILLDLGWSSPLNTLLLKLGFYCLIVLLCILAVTKVAGVILFTLFCIFNRWHAQIPSEKFKS